MLLGNYVEMIRGTAFPALPYEPQLFYRDDLNTWFIYDGTAWVSLLGGMIVHGNAWHAPAFATAAALAAHIAAVVAGTHGSSVAAAINTLIHRDAAGRAQIVNPAVNADIDNMGARDAAILVEALTRALADFMHETITTPPIHGSTVAATFNMLVHRDGAGRAQIINPTVNADIDNLGARNTAIGVHAALPDVHHAEDHAPEHESGGGDEITVTYDICEAFLLPYLLFRRLVRFMHIQFECYDMINTWTAGTGYVQQLFFRPLVRSGAVAGGRATQYQNYAFMYIDRAAVFVGQAAYTNDTRDGAGFLGLALVDNHIMAVDDISKHAGFLFYVSGATQTVYAQSGDGVGVEKTDLSVDPDNFAIWAMIGDGSTIKFYRNWSLVATHTVRIPAGSLCWKISVVSGENLDNAMDTRRFVWGQVA